jgi:type IV secretory pathway VirB9-like protein
MIVLPDGEDIVDFTCGDADNWVINVVQNTAHVKPAKEGARTNLNLVTTSGRIYSFLVTEDNRGGQGRGHAGPEGLRASRSLWYQGASRAYASIAQVEALEAELRKAQASLEAAQRASEKGR